MKVYISKNADKRLISYLKTYTKNIEYIHSDVVYSAVSSHPDIYMCQMGNHMFMGDKNKLGYSYPENIRYNGVCVGKYFIHNLKYTDPDLLSKVLELDYTTIDVKQGYTKCNVLPVDDKSIITSDHSIAKKCQNYLDVLLIHPGYINLPGVNYGFIGGCTGIIDDTVIFNGNLSAHPDYEKIKEFIEKRNLKIKYFEDYPLTDIGSILISS